jgi:ubiquitin-activating enzyme E1
MTELN